MEKKKRERDFCMGNTIKKGISTFCFSVHFHFHSFHLSHAGNETIITQTRKKIQNTEHRTEHNCTFCCKHKLLITVSRNLTFIIAAINFIKVSTWDMIGINNDICTYGIVGEFQNERIENYCNYFDACQSFVLVLKMFLFEVHWEQMAKIYTIWFKDIFGINWWLWAGVIRYFSSIKRINYFKLICPIWFSFFEKNYCTQSYKILIVNSLELYCYYPLKLI